MAEIMQKQLAPPERVYHVLAVINSKQLHKALVVGTLKSKKERLAHYAHTWLMHGLSPSVAIGPLAFEPSTVLWACRSLSL